MEQKFALKMAKQMEQRRPEDIAARDSTQNAVMQQQQHEMTMEHQSETGNDDN